MSDVLPPHEPSMESAIIGCIIQKPEVFDECQSRFKVGQEVFYIQSNRVIYSEMLALRSAGAPIDLVSLVAQISRSNLLAGVGGLEYLSQCERDAVVSNFDYYADKISEAYLMRRTLATCAEASEEVYNNRSDAESIILNIESRLKSIREIRSSDLIVNGTQSANLLSANLEMRFDLQGKKSGIETGLDKLDSLTDGLQFGEQTIIGARPSMGKTALATTIIRKACLIDKVPTLVITLEMSIQALVRRILSAHHRISMADLRSGRFCEQDFSKFSSFHSLLKKSPIYFLDSISGIASDRICSGIQRAVKSHGIKLVVIDYLQKIHATGKHEKRTYEVAQVSGALKAVAVQTGVAMLTLAQLNREPDQQKGRVPRLSDLADSGQIERDGDCIGLLHRDRDKPTEASLILAKQRDGDIGTVPLLFEGQYCWFSNPDNQT